MGDLGLFFCMHAAVATHGQYLALSKAWWSCGLYVCTGNTVQTQINQIALYSIHMSLRNVFEAIFHKSNLQKTTVYCCDLPYLQLAGRNMSQL